ncbi:MAG: PQQ-binding-like beta-propeller repeat protein [Planctomycetota bacterium]
MLKTIRVLSALIFFFVFANLLWAADDSRWLVPQSKLDPAELKIVWQYNLPLAEREALDQVRVFGNRLYALSSRNYLSCLNRADGNVMFSNFVAPAGLPLTGLEFHEGELITIVGSKLIEISADAGTEQTSTNITSGVTCPVVRNDSFFYVAGGDKRLHALRADDKVQLFEVAAESDSTITAVLADEEFVIFATVKGNVICIKPDKPVKLWQFDAPGAIAGIARDSTSLYVACSDTNIYRLDLTSGKLLWKYQTQAILDASPISGDKVVYQHIPNSGLIALDKQTGKLLWQLPDGLGLLAESGDKAFVITETGLLAAMDNVKAKKLYSVDIGQAVKYTTNTADSKIYIADAQGRLACLEPVR